MLNGWEDFLKSGSPDDGHSPGNRVEHLPHDNRAARAMWEAIEQARVRVWMTMYCIGADAVGLGTLERLAGAARRGCEVLLVYDYIGSLGLGDRHLEPLRRAGGQVAAFNRPWPPWKRTGSLGIRNHRKLILIDDATAFCGGMNLAEDYVAGEDGVWIFDDTSVRIDGPCAHDLMKVFLRTWEEETGERRTPPPPAPPQPEGMQVQVLETDPRRPETHLVDVLGNAIARTRTSCHITTPYFIPAPWLYDALEQALRNGADVQILTAGHSDVGLARLAGRSCYGALLRRGARVFEMQGRTIHTKKLTLDGAFCAVGSHNFDIWTSRHVLDVSVAMVDEALARSFEQEFEEDLAHSREVDLETWNHRGPLNRLAENLSLLACKHL